MNILELLAALLTIINVVMTIRRTIWCWPVGAVSVVLYFFVFLEAKLYADMTLQVVYFILQFYGWYQWMYGGKHGSELPVSRITVRQLVCVVLMGVLGTGGIGMALWFWTDAALPLWDAGVTVFSMLSVWMMARKLLENWIFWTLLNIVYIGMFINRNMYPSLGLYVVLLIMAVIGYREWFKQWRKEQIREVPVAKADVV